MCICNEHQVAKKNTAKDMTQEVFSLNEKSERDDETRRARS